MPEKKSENEVIDMTEKFEPDFYTVRHAELVELLDVERTAPVAAELERRALDELKRVFQLYREVFNDRAAERLSEDAASLFVDK
nr:hypothetical protein [uncultured bacterium]